ncbi:integrase, catalytic region, zinc finger, CCHC-type containing protein [Tanacetum coccineum]
MSTSKTYQQSLADVGSETRLPMLERGSYIPWASRFRRYINRKRENQKWLNKALDEGPYQFEMFIPNNSTVPKLKTTEYLQGDVLLHYDAEIELMNLILLSIPNDIYNSVDACTSAKDMWKRVEWEALVSVYNRFAQLMNNLERNDMHFPIVTINTKFLNSLQPEWLKYVTQVRLAKRLTMETFDDLFDYLQQFEKLVNVSRSKKLEKYHDPLAPVAHTGSSSRNTPSYYVTQPTSVVDYDDEYQQDDVHTNSEDPLAFAINQAIIQGEKVNIQNRNSGNAGRNNRRAYVQEEIVEGSNAPNETGNVQRTIRTSSSGNTSTVQCYKCSRKGHYARNFPKPRVQDLKYFMEQMVLAKQDKAGVILTDDVTPLFLHIAAKANPGRLLGDVEELWDELAKLGLGLRCCLVLMVSRLNLVPKEVIWRCVVAWLVFKWVILEGKRVHLVQGTLSSIPIVGSISPEGSLSLILLLVVIIAMVVVMVVIVVAIVGVVIVVTVIGVVVMASSIPIDWVNEFHQNKASSVSVLIANFTLFFSAHLLRENTNSVCLNQRIRPTAPSVPLKQKACASRAVATLSATSFLMAALVMAGASDVDVLLGGIYQHKITWNKNDITNHVYVGKNGGTRIRSCFRDELDNVFEEEDGGWIHFLGGNNSSGTDKYRGSNSSDGDNTGDEVKIAGGEIGCGGGIGGISSFLEFSEKSEKMFPSKAGKVLQKEVPKSSNKSLNDNSLAIFKSVPLRAAKKTWWSRLGAGVYDSWKLQGDVEELWDELAKLGLGLRCCLVFMVPRLNLVPKEVMWRGDFVLLRDEVGESRRCVVAWLVFKWVILEGKR